MTKSPSDGPRTWSAIFQQMLDERTEPFLIPTFSKQYNTLGDLLDLAREGIESGRLNRDSPVYVRVQKKTAESSPDDPPQFDDLTIDLFFAQGMALYIELFPND